MPIDATHVKPLEGEDLGSALELWELVGQMHADRIAHARQLRNVIVPPREELVVKLKAILAFMGKGLTLGAAAASVGIGRRVLATWVVLGDTHVEPWASWLTLTIARDAERKLRLLADLDKLGEVDVTSRRQSLLLRGKPSPLEMELDALRRVRTALEDSLRAQFKESPAPANEPAQSTAEGAEGEHETTEERASAIQSVSDSGNHAASDAECAEDEAQPVQSVAPPAWMRSVWQGIRPAQDSSTAPTLEID